MKKLIIISLWLFSVGMTAQNVSLGVRTGVNFSTFLEKVPPNELSPETDYRIGGHIGLILDIKIADFFYLEPGLYFTTRGGKEVEEISLLYPSSTGSSRMDINAGLTVKTSYLQLPVLASFRLPVTEKIRCHLDVGPYVAYGVYGKIKDIKANINAMGQQISNAEIGLQSEMDFFGDDAARRFDAGLCFGIGIDVKKVFIGLNYDLGLLNMVADSDNRDDGFSTKNSNIGVRVGFNFW